MTGYDEAINYDAAINYNGDINPAVIVTGAGSEGADWRKKKKKKRIVRPLSSPPQALMPTPPATPEAAEEPPPQKKPEDPEALRLLQMNAIFAFKDEIGVPVYVQPEAVQDHGVDRFVELIGAKIRLSKASAASIEKRRESAIKMIEDAQKSLARREAEEDDDILIMLAAML